MGTVRLTERSPPAPPRETLMSTQPSPAATRPSTSTVRRPRSEIRALTGLRAVAASWVVLFHFEPELTAVC